MQVIKGTAAEPERTAETAGDMELINSFAKEALKPEDVFIFSVRLCDNRIDRDYERFTDSALEELKERFTGKTGIFDHQWTAKGQVARIFRTQVIAEPDGVRWLKAWAYMLRTPGNEELIREIQGGIKREVSVGCSVKYSRCSVCGGDIGSCGHVKGKMYDGKMCFAELSGVTDAYEWSFVAVPAQRESGIVKKFGGGQEMTLESIAGIYGGENARKELSILREEARMGRSYMSGLREQVVRLSVTAGSGLDRELMRSAAEKMDEGELLGFKRAFEEKIEKLLPLETQLGAIEENRAGGDEEFRI